MIRCSCITLDPVALRRTARGAFQQASHEAGAHGQQPRDATNSILQHAEANQIEVIGPPSPQHQLERSESPAPRQQTIDAMASQPSNDDEDDDDDDMEEALQEALEVGSHAHTVQHASIWRMAALLSLKKAHFMHSYAHANKK